MAKFKVIDKAGFFIDKKKHAPGTVIEIAPGAHLKTALHFAQVEAVKEKPAEADESKGGAGEKKK